MNERKERKEGTKEKERIKKSEEGGEERGKGKEGK